MTTSSSSRPSLLATLATGCLALSGCMSASSHLAAVRDNPTDRLTLGVVQKDLHHGMSGAEVIGLLGAPNVVTTDEQRREVWVYDKLASEVVHSSTGAGLSPLLLGSGGHFAGGLSGNVAHAAGATSRNERMLTVVVKFDEQKRVRDFAYRASQF